MKKILLIIIDGLGDDSIKGLGNKTPLDSAKTPNLDFLAKNGICGLMEPFSFPKQKAPTSDISHLALLGYDPKKYYLGRGIYEALGINLALKSNDVALRGNFGTVDSKHIIKDRRAGRIEKIEDLVRELNKIKIKGVKIFIKKSLGHRIVLRMRGKRISPQINGNDFKKIKVKIPKVEAKKKEGKFTASILNEFLEKAHLVLKNHPLNKRRVAKRLMPANYLLIRGAGCYSKVPSFRKRFGLKACCIAGGALYKGVAKSLGMEIVKSKGATGDIKTNLKEKFLTIKKALKKYDFVFLHIKATDTLGEDGNFFGKKSFIEKIDRNLKYILDLENIVIAITSDHRTCCSMKGHCSGNVPLLIHGGKKDKIQKFSEKDCKKGKLKIVKALNLIKLLKSLQGK